MDLSSYQQRRKLIKRIIFWSILIGGLIALFFGPTVIEGFAQPTNVCEALGNCVEGVEAVDPSRQGVTGFLLNLAYIAIFISGGIAVLFMIFGAYKMITSNGSEDAYTDGIKTLRNATIGLVLAIISLTIVTLVSSLVSNLNLSNLFS